jgi:hypothetical protein
MARKEIQALGGQAHSIFCNMALKHDLTCHTCIIYQEIGTYYYIANTLYVVPNPNSSSTLIENYPICMLSRLIVKSIFDYNEVFN